MDNLARKPDPQAVRLVRSFNATPERVFAAWTQPDQIARWFGPKGFTMEVDAMKVAPGGLYRFAMTPPDGSATRFIIGRYVEIAVNRRLVFSWAWEDQSACGDTNAPDDSLVTVELEPDGKGTRVALTHERLSTDESRQGHLAGWTGSFDCLDEYLA